MIYDSNYRQLVFGLTKSASPIPWLYTSITSGQSIRTFNADSFWRHREVDMVVISLTLLNSIATDWLSNHLQQSVFL